MLAAKKANPMRKTLPISVILMLLCPLVLLAAPARKGDDREGTKTETRKRDSGPPPKPDHHPAPTAPTPRPPQSHPGGGSGHGGSDQGVIHRPDPVRPPHRPNVSPQPYRRDDWQPDRFSYPTPGRAYSQPPPRRPNWDGRRDHDDHFWSGGWGWGSSWDWNFGYRSPFRREVLVPVPYPVPGPTVYYPAPSSEYGPDYGPEYVPAPLPADGLTTAAPEDLPLLGCDIVAGDGKFLGVIDREYDSPQSIANRNSDFGNPASPLSLWNPKGAYGSPTSQYSPWNPEAQSPPMLSWHGVFKAYLSTNPQVKPAIDPASLSEVIKASPWR